MNNCEWSQVDTSSDMWETECGESFVFIADGPEENDMKFCCYCGESLIAIRAIDDTEDN
jgi:hypothetical protein